MEDSPHFFPGSSSDLEKAERAAIGVVEAIELLQDDIMQRKQTSQLSRSHDSEEKQLAKKLKRSTGGEIMNSTEGVAIPSLKLDADDPTELIVAAQGYSCFRMLMPAEDDATVDCNKDKLVSLIGEGKAKVDIYSVAGVRVVMLWGKDDPCSTASPVVEAFSMVHKYLLDALVYSHSPFRFTRLLVSAEQAKSLMHSTAFIAIHKECRCFVYVYLTDIVSVLSDGDAIIELLGMPQRVSDAISKIATHLRQFPVNESMISMLESQRGIYSREENLKAKFSRMKAERPYEVHHFLNIPLSYVDRIIGENGKNIAAVRSASSAVIVIEPLSCDDTDTLYMEIRGVSTPDCLAAENVMEGFIDKKDGPRVFEETGLTTLFLYEPIYGEQWDVPIYRENWDY